MKIKDKIVLISGANRGIGQALVTEALHRGAKKVYAGTRTSINHPDKRVVPLTLDITDTVQIGKAAAGISELDVLINNAGVAFYDDLSDSRMLDKHLAVNLYGPYHMTQAFLPVLKRSHGAIVNNLSLVALAPFAPIASYSVSKAAAFSMTQSLRAYLAGDGVSVHAVMTGPVDTDMNRGLDIPKTPPETAARNIFDGLESGQEEIFPDPMSAQLADNWNTGGIKAMERQNAMAVRQNFTTTLLVDRSPEEVFNAVCDVRGWWSGLYSEEIKGNTTELHDEFTFRAGGGAHYSKQKIVESIPGKKVVWLVTDSELSFLEKKDEWIGTRISFVIAKRGAKTELTFTHEGLVPEIECYDSCSNAWRQYVQEKLPALINSAG